MKGPSQRAAVCLCFRARCVAVVVVQCAVHVHGHELAPAGARHGRHWQRAHEALWPAPRWPVAVLQLLAPLKECWPLQLLAPLAEPASHCRPLPWRLPWRLHAQLSQESLAAPRVRALAGARR